MNTVLQIKKIGFRLALVMFMATAFLLSLPAEEAHAGNPSLYFSPSTLSANTGTTYSVKIMINTDGDEADGVTADISYPSSTLQLISVSSANSVFPSTAEENTSTPGTVKISRFITGTTYNGTGEVATLNFKPLREGTITVPFTSNAKITSAGVDILDTTGSLIITATGAPADGDGDGDLPNTALIDTRVAIAGGILLVIIGVTIAVSMTVRKKKERESFNREYMNP